MWPLVLFQFRRDVFRAGVDEGFRRGYAAGRRVAKPIVLADGQSKAGELRAEPSYEPARLCRSRR
jgi:hypothetical protein